MENFGVIFTSEDKIEIKKSMINVLINQFKTDLENKDTYLVNPSDIDSWFDEKLEKTVDEAFENVKDELKELVNNKLEVFMKSLVLIKKK